MGSGIDIVREGEVRDDLEGVRGWLLLFCLSLVLFGPLYTAYNLVSGYQDLKELGPYLEYASGIEGLYWLDFILSASVAAFSIFVGVELWTIQKNAVSHAKRFLLSVLAYNLSLPFLPYFAGIEADVYKEITPELIGFSVRGSIYVAIWYAFLNKSKRVAATYRAEMMNEYVEHSLNNKSIQNSGDTVASEAKISEKAREFFVHARDLGDSFRQTGQTQPPGDGSELSSDVEITENLQTSGLQIEDQLDDKQANKDQGDSSIRPSCPKCEHPVASQYVFCPECGTRIRPQTCAHCNLEIEGNHKYCPYCGKPVDK